MEKEFCRETFEKTLNQPTTPQYAQKVKKWKKPHISRSKVVMNDHDPSLESIWGNYLEKIEKILSL